MLKAFFSYQKFILVPLALLLSCHLFSQNFIRGTVLDTTKTGFPFVNIALLNSSDSSQVKGTISDETGKYEFTNIRSGNYILKFFAIGYSEAYSEIFHIDSVSVITVPEIMMSNKGVNLNEISVTSIKRTVEFKNGMTILNVENSIMAAGNTVIDVLKRIPGVTVDNKNNISISGKQGVRIMLDGRMQQLSMEQVVSMLSAMSADHVSKIEVMKSPPVKYDAEGNAGIINIVTKKITTKGYSGSINYNPGMGQRFGNSMYATLNFKSNKLTIFSNINPMYKTFFDRYDYHKRVTYEDNTTIFDHTGDHENLRKYMSGKIGADYAITPKTTIGLSVANTINNTRPVEHGYVSINGYNDVGFDHYHYVTDDKTIWTSPAYNFNAEHKFDTTGTTISLSVDYAAFNNTSDRRSESVFLKNDDSYAKPSQVYQSTNNSKINIFTQKLDFQTYLKPSWFFEAGAKTTFVNNASDFLFTRQDTVTGSYYTDTSFTNNYRYKETLIAGYINFRKEFKKGTLGLGVRAENTEIRGNNLTNGFKLTRSYLNFFPNLSFDYQLNDKHSIQFNYNRRLDRPDYSQLNPFKRFEDQYAVAAGNPYLNPQYSDNVDFVHTYNQWITNSIGYAHFTHLFSDISYQNDSTKITTFTQVNLDQSDYYYYNLFLQKQLKSWWNAEFSLNVFYTSYHSKIGTSTLNTSAVSSNIYFNNDFVLPKNFKLQLTMHYNAPTTYGANHNKANGSCDFGVKKILFNQKFTVMIQFLDMFYTDISRTLYDFGNQYYTFNLRDDTRRFRLTLSYKFGKTNIRVREKLSNEQETGRLKKD
ncbi:MAG: TonB-dependent receptor [Bacteroidetes bacterium]|nr:TonB-dependent receptor [Bacteroidota bacterium]